MSDAKPESAPKKSKKLLVVALAVLLLAGGGGGAWYYLGHKGADGDDAEEAHAAKKKQAAKPLFTSLDPFTVNLQDPRGERFAQIGVTLQFEDPEVEALIKDHMPAVRNDILMLISSKQIEDLLSIEGKQKLAQEIRLRAGRALGVDLPEPEVTKPKADAAQDAVAKADAGQDAVAKADPKAAAKDDASDASDEDDDDKAARRAAAKRKKRKPKAAPENPIRQVLFSQFIVQ